MVWEYIKGSTSPPKNVCAVIPTGPFDFHIQCNLTPDIVRQIVDKDKVCIIEHDKSGTMLSYCGQGKDVVARLFR
jgi:hypothetical protein